MDYIGQRVDYAEGHKQLVRIRELRRGRYKELATSRNQVLTSHRQAGVLPMLFARHCSEALLSVLACLLFRDLHNVAILMNRRAVLIRFGEFYDDGLPTDSAE